jgi:predicted hydrolase (HD superfamily)
MEITVDRLKHSAAVASKMKELATQHPGRYCAGLNDAFILGMLHDIGYEFSTIQEEHAHEGGLVLKEQGYKYWQEVYYHGVLQHEYDPPMLRLLDHADMITGPAGENRTIQERIEDIAKRYGKGSR